MTAEVENVSRETFDLVDQWYQDHQQTLAMYADRLWWWNKKVNLISRELAKEDLHLHIKHSLVIGLLLKDSPLQAWVDAGSGGGLPGIPLAILHPERSIILNDISPKKGVVLRDMAYHLHLQNVRVDIGDIAKLSVNVPFGVISKHAFKLEPLLHALDSKPWQEIVLLKGEDYLEEMNQLTERSIVVKSYALNAYEPTTFYAGKYLLHLCRIV